MLTPADLTDTTQSGGETFPLKVGEDSVRFSEMKKKKKELSTTFTLGNSLRQDGPDFYKAMQDKDEGSKPHSHSGEDRAKISSITAAVMLE